MRLCATTLASKLLWASILLAGFQGGSTEFNSFAQAENQIVQEAWQAKDYAKAHDALQKLLAAYAKLPKDEQQKTKIHAQTAWYNEACYFSLNGNTPKAVEALQHAVDLGYNNYAHLQEDTDLDNLRGDAAFESLLSKVREVGDYGYLLEKAKDYDVDESCSKPMFTYEDTFDAKLKAINKKYDLDMVAGRGDDISKVMRLMRWVHLNANHDGSNMAPVPKNAVDLLTYARDEKRGINCRCMSITLNDIYQAAGFKSRHITCMPKDPKDPDCHVINIVFVPSLKKWVWMDASFCAYFKDENGNLLDIREVRDRVINHRPLVCSPEINWNGTQYTAKQYINYMSKNMYWFTTPLHSETDYESGSTDTDHRVYISLLPKNFWPDKERGKETAGLANFKTIYTSDPDYFWQTPK